MFLFHRCDALKKQFASKSSWKHVQSKDGIDTYYRQVPGKNIHSLRVEGLVDAPLPYVLALLYEADLYHKWVPNFKLFGHEKSRKIYSPPGAQRQ